jgi:adenine-specific DNA-methyltransferase
VSETTSLAVDESHALRKMRGAFFTRPEVAEFIVEWAVRDRRDKTFEPSCAPSLQTLR